MTVILRRAEPRDIDDICELLHTHMNPDFSVERWERIFTPSWCVFEHDFGIVALDKGRVVGFHGHICSNRTVNSRRERFVNFTSWYILKEYRRQGLGSEMLKMATSDQNATYTVFSLSPKRIEFFKTLGLEVLEEERFLWRKTGAPYDNLELFFDLDKIHRYASPREVKVLDDHLGLPLTPVLVSTRCTQCLLLLSIAKKKDDVTYYDILYRSNPALLTDRANHIAEAMLPDGKAVLATDKRFLIGARPVPGEPEVEIIKSPRFYKSARVKPSDIDLAYSELALLGLKLD